MFSEEYSPREEYESSFAAANLPECSQHGRQRIATSASSSGVVIARTKIRCPYRAESSTTGFCGNGVPDGPVIPTVSLESKRSGTHYMTDWEAAMRIEHSFGRAKRRHSQLIARILGNLINQRSPLSNDSLESLKVAADNVIFDGILGDRVTWRWSYEDELQYGKDLLGTTALREAPCGHGFETSIVLSRPLLLDKEFNRDLLLSTFFHELIHCYLFLQCGLEHAHDDGHTDGFRKIAGIINEWIIQANGHQRLHLCNMRANLDQFRRRRRPQCGARSRYFRYERCRSGSNSPEYIPFQEHTMGCNR